MPDTTPALPGADFPHHGGIVGRLEQRITRGHEQQRREVARNAECSGQRRQRERAGQHPDQPQAGDAVRTEAVGDAPAGAALKAATSGPADITTPSCAASSPSPRAGRTTRQPASSSSPSIPVRSARGSSRTAGRATDPGGSGAIGPSPRHGRRGRCRMRKSTSSTMLSRSTRPAEGHRQRVGRKAGRQQQGPGDINAGISLCQVIPDPRAAGDRRATRRAARAAG